MEGTRMTRMYDVEQYEGRAINPRAIKALRLQARLTQQELASAAEIGISTFNTWERDRAPKDHRPRVGNVLKIAEALSARLGRTVDPGELLLPRESEPVGIAS
jgi:transcriptional regulator with XRE-family HTH domain